ncbi:MAG: diaminopimelate epimerase [Candidatus Aminicenantes bacterium]|nr:diaminopimelate epimerase [Candidatus Aminicenantes bacterium]
MIFYKSVSAGNDFIHIDAAEVGAVSKGDLTEKICDRNKGAGADGVVFYEVQPGAAGAGFEIFNRDGSRAELSGNGMAGLSALLFYLDKFSAQVVLFTSSGRKTIELLERRENEFRLKIEIGEADFSRLDFFPFLREKRLDYEYAGFTFYPVSVGNPHVVVLLEKEFPFEEIMAAGRELESAGLFPRKTNVEFVLHPLVGGGLYEGGEECRVFYYERGVGHTFSSSTGSAAVFAVLQKLGFVEDHLVVGTLPEKIKISFKKGIYIENSTKIVYKGVFINTGIK